MSSLGNGNLHDLSFQTMRASMQRDAGLNLQLTPIQLSTAEQPVPIANMTNRTGSALIHGNPLLNPFGPPQAPTAPMEGGPLDGLGSSTIGSGVLWYMEGEPTPEDADDRALFDAFFPCNPLWVATLLKMLDNPNMVLRQFASDALESMLPRCPDLFLPSLRGTAAAAAAGALAARAQRIIDCWTFMEEVKKFVKSKNPDVAALEAAVLKAQKDNICPTWGGLFFQALNALFTVKPAPIKAIKDTLKKQLEK